MKALDMIRESAQSLRDVLPVEALGCEYDGAAFQKYLEVEVDETIESHDKRFPFKHRHIYIWWILKNGIAVGWNENPSVGWSFPVAKIKETS